MLTINTNISNLRLQRNLNAVNSAAQTALGRLSTSVVEGNTVTNENLSASKSRIKDADVAKESAALVKNQILENATTALLAQTKNVNGDIALQLLQVLG